MKFEIKETMLFKDGVQAICPFQTVALVKDHLGSLQSLRQNCSTLCACFNIVKTQIPNTEHSTQHTEQIEAHLRCGAGNKFPLSNAEEKKPESVIKNIR